MVQRGDRADPCPRQAKPPPLPPLSGMDGAISCQALEARLRSEVIEAKMQDIVIEVDRTQWQFDNGHAQDHLVDQHCNAAD